MVLNIPILFMTIEPFRTVIKHSVERYIVRSSEVSMGYTLEGCQESIHNPPINNTVFNIENNYTVVLKHDSAP